MIQQLIGMLVAISLAGCSAIELGEQNIQATTQQQATIENMVDNRIATQQVTLDAIYAQATDSASMIETQIAQTVIAIIALTPSPTAEPLPDSESTAEVTAEPMTDFVATSADSRVYGRVPVDSDSLNSITALAFDGDGNLLVSLRAGEIYRLEDNDSDGLADQPTLIFEDVEGEIGQVSGIFAENALLYVINGSQLSQLRDTDDDGVFDSVTHLSESLPANQALLQANNSIVRSPDGRYFTADVNTGEILQLTLLEVAD